MRGVTSLRFVRPLLVSVALGIPFALVALLASRWVGPISHASVGLLLQVTAPLRTTPEAPLVVTEPWLDEPVALAIEAATKPRPKGAKSSPSVKPSSLFVSQATVLKLANSGARPRGAFVVATEQHPAGLHLSGVAGLGIGLQDGDILIEALGVTPRAPEQVIGAIIEARAKQARFLSGTLWRRGQTFRITVEQPYLPLPA
jgi:hypothetical protein